MTPARARLLQQIEQGLEWHGGFLTLADLTELARARRVQVWSDPDGERALAATEILAYPRRKVLNAVVAAGSVAGVLELQPHIEAFARQEGADAMVTHGRPGWGRVGRATGWQAHSMLFIRRLKSANGGAR